MNVPADPLDLFRAWFDQAVAAGVHAPEAVALSTATPDGRPSTRMVLYRGLSGEGLRFFTNYESRKGREIAANPFAALLFYWAPLGRQVRVEGRVEKLDAAESDAYFAARPRGHRIGAWTSPQSREITGRDELLARLAEVEARFGETGEVPRPPHWGGYRVVPDRWEFWIDGKDRLHSRTEYRPEAGVWRARVLGP